MGLRKPDLGGEDLTVEMVEQDNIIAELVEAVNGKAGVGATFKSFNSGELITIDPAKNYLGYWLNSTGTSLYLVFSVEKGVVTNNFQNGNTAYQAVLNGNTLSINTNGMSGTVYYLEG